MKFIATCKMGVESLVSLELKKLGMSNIAAEDARVSFEGSMDDMAKACIWLRTAERLLMEVASFEATTFDELYEGTRKVDWRQYFLKDSFIHVNGKSAKSTLFSVSDCQSIVKKAIVDQLLNSYHIINLPETGNHVIVEVGILRNHVTIALDCCGAGLSRRGYRTYNVDAPIAETLGAAIVMLSRFRRDMELIDPMCGSGTMPIEAAMIAENRAPGLIRSFAAENWHFLSASAFTNARLEARELITPQKLNILGSDVDARCIDLCKKHAKKAGVMLDWKIAPISELSIRKESGIIVCNPPYGERLMNAKATEKLYHEMRRVFDGFPYHYKHIITSNREFESIFGKKADKRRKLSNGGMTCTLYSYFGDKLNNNEL